MDEKKQKNHNLFFKTMNGITYTKFNYTKEAALKKEQKFERQNRYQMIKDICQKLGQPTGIKNG